MRSLFDMKNIRIVTRQDDADFEEARPPLRMHEDVQNLRTAALKGKPWAVEKLKDRVRHFPKYPVFKNLLFTAYIAKNNPRAAREVAEQMYREHPEYVYARTALAESLIEAGGNIQRAKKILHPSLNITEAFPNRKSFHFGEFVNYERAVILYLTNMGAIEEAFHRLKLLKDSGFADDALLHYLQDYIEKNQPYNPELPALQTQGLEVLFFAGQFMTPEVARDILTVPRTILVADLCRILDDATERSVYWMRDEHPEFTTFAPLHAMILLAELEAEEALPAIIRFLKQSGETVDFWLDDFVTELLPEILARFASPAQYETFAQFATGKHIDEFVCGAFISGVRHRAERHPELRESATAWLAGVIEKLMSDAVSGDYNGHLNLAVSEIIDLQGKSLLPLAEKCFQLDLIDKSMQGDYENFLESFQEAHKWRSDSQYINLESAYRFIKDFGWGEREKIPERPGNIWLEKILSAAGTSAAAMEEDEPESAQMQPQFLLNHPAPTHNIHKAAPSQNGPCPCGSGKKYKRCCGKEK